jgi:hypothetical protein
MNRARQAGATALSLFLLLGPGFTAAQAQEARPPLSSASLGGLARLRADIDGGGHFSVNAGRASATLGRTFGTDIVADAGFSYTYEDWRFGTPDAFGPSAPWGAINQPSIGASLRYRYSDRLTLLLAPQVEWNYETGASASDGLSYGAVLGGLYTYSPALTVGLGAGVFRQVNRTQVFPFVIVNWQISDKLSLSNPLEAGPTGGPGLELTYEINEAWDAGVGVAFRDTRFRLRRDGPTPNGIGQDKGVPVFAHVAFSPTASLTVDFYAGAVVNGNLRVLDSNGSTVTSSDYDAQPVLGIRASYAF